MTSAWEELRRRCEACQACGLSRTRNKLVFGVGKQDSPILFVGEGPGQQEDLQGEPFVGAAGKLLDEMLSIIDLGRDNCYIANIVKCRPPGNRDPREEEQRACVGFLMEQMQLIKPKIVICLGRIAAGVLIRKEFRITRDVRYAQRQRRETQMRTPPRTSDLEPTIRIPPANRGGRP